MSGAPLEQPHQLPTIHNSTPPTCVDVTVVDEVDAAAAAADAANAYDQALELVAITAAAIGQGKVETNHEVAHHAASPAAPPITNYTVIPESGGPLLCHGAPTPPVAVSQLPQDSATHHNAGDTLSESVVPNNHKTTTTTAHWIVSKRDEKWNLMYQRLVAFVQQHGHTRVPQSYPPDVRLGRWVKYQRGEYAIYCRQQNQQEQQEKTTSKASLPTTTRTEPSTATTIHDKNSTYHTRNKHRPPKITPSRIAQLNALGFEWDPGHVTWHKMYQRLRQFYQAQGHAHVPKQYAPDLELANWVRNQKLQQDRLSSERKQLLHELHLFQNGKINHQKKRTSTVRQPQPQAEPKSIHEGKQ